MTSPAADDEVRALNEKVFHEVLALISAGRHNDMVDLMHDDLVFELPYGPEGMRGPHNKKSFAGMQDYVFGMFDNFSIGVTELHRGLDPNELVAEYASKCTVKATGGPYNNRYVGIVQFKDGKVASWKEFHNPEIATKALSPG